MIDLQRKEINGHLHALEKSGIAPGGLIPLVFVFLLGRPSHWVYLDYLYSPIALDCGRTH